MKLYAIKIWNESIEEVEASRCNENSVWFRRDNGTERREKRSTEYARYFDTHADAVEYYRRRLEAEVRQFMDKLSGAEARLKALNQKYATPTIPTTEEPHAR